MTKPNVIKTGKAKDTKLRAKRAPGLRVTEQANPATEDIDTLDALGVVDRINDEDLKVAPAVRAARRELAQVIELCIEAFRVGGRLFYVGAGTSGRLGVLDASECPPTFSTPPYLVQGLIAGGPPALQRSVEGAEDDEEAGALALRHRGLMREDVVVGIAASGTTPYVRGALVEANRTGAATVLVTCNPEAPLARLARVTVALAVGPEVIAGSTRMKAGTATKLALNTITTGAMIRWGKVYGNRMVDVKPACAKLVERATRLVADLAEVPHERAALLLEAGGGRVKVAVVMHRRGCTRKEAEKVLAHSSGLLRRALALDKLPPEPEAPPRARPILVRKVKAEVPKSPRAPQRTRSGGKTPLPASRARRRKA